MEHYALLLLRFCFPSCGRKPWLLCQLLLSCNRSVNYTHDAETQYRANLTARHQQRSCKNFSEALPLDTRVAIKFPSQFDIAQYFKLYTIVWLSVMDAPFLMLRGIYPLGRWEVAGWFCSQSEKLRTVRPRPRTCPHPIELLQTVVVHGWSQ